MSTQLRLVEPPEPKRSGRARVVSSIGPSASGSRRATRWGDWRLDARTRRIGRAGIAAARQALEDAPLPEHLSRAS